MVPLADQQSQEDAGYSVRFPANQIINKIYQASWWEMACAVALFQGPPGWKSRWVGAMLW
jgi:hypothetical protein